MLQKFPLNEFLLLLPARRCSYVSYLTILLQRASCLQTGYLGKKKVVLFPEIGRMKKKIISHPPA